MNRLSLLENLFIHGGLNRVTLKLIETSNNVTDDYSSVIVPKLSEYGFYFFKLNTNRLLGYFTYAIEFSLFYLLLHGITLYV